MSHQKRHLARYHSRPPIRSVLAPCIHNSLHKFVPPLIRTQWKINYFIDRVIYRPKGANELLSLLPQLPFTSASSGNQRGGKSTRAVVVVVAVRADRRSERARFSSDPSRLIFFFFSGPIFLVNRPVYRGVYVNKYPRTDAHAFCPIDYFAWRCRTTPASGRKLPRDQGKQAVASVHLVTSRISYVNPGSSSWCS